MRSRYSSIIATFFDPMKFLKNIVINIFFEKSNMIKSPILSIGHSYWEEESLMIILLKIKILNENLIPFF